MKTFSKEQLEEMMKLQKELDDRIRKEKNIPEDKDLLLEKYIALKTELFEFVNQIESFKYWKENKGKDEILEEACDTLHFLLSIAIDTKNEIVLKEILIQEEIDKTDTNELIAIIDMMLLDIFEKAEFSHLGMALMTILAVLNRYGFDSDDLYEAYIKKNKVNHERQDNKY